MEFLELIFYAIEAMAHFGFWYAGAGDEERTLTNIKNTFVSNFLDILFYLNFVLIIIYSSLIYFYPAQYKNWNTYLILGVSTILIVYRFYKHKHKDRPAIR